MIIRFAAALSIVSAVPGVAHVTVWPKSSVAGAHEKYVVRVPNEKQSDMIAVELTLPAKLKVTSFEQKTGWSTELRRDTSGAITGVRWAGRLPPQQFAEFGLLAVNPAAAGTLSFGAVQFYADGTRSEWSGPPSSKTPAPQVTITPAR